MIFPDTMLKIRGRANAILIRFLRTVRERQGDGSDTEMTWTRRKTSKVVVTEIIRYKGAAPSERWRSTTFVHLKCEHLILAKSNGNGRLILNRLCEKWDWQAVRIERTLDSWISWRLEEEADDPLNSWSIAQIVNLAPFLFSSSSRPFPRLNSLVGEHTIPRNR